MVHPSGLDVHLIMWYINGMTRPLAEQREQDRLRTLGLRRKSVPGSYTNDQWLKLLGLCDNRCVACGSTENIQRDHIIPLTWEGATNYIENLQPLCFNCNSTKQDLYAADYRPALARAWAFLEAIPWQSDGL